MEEKIIHFLHVVILVLTVAVASVAYVMRNVAVIPCGDSQTVQLEVLGNVWEKSYADFSIVSK